MYRILFLISFLWFAGCAADPDKALNSSGLGVGNVPPETALAFTANRDFGQSLNQSDKEKLTEAEFRALNYGSSGVPMDWKGSSADTSGSVLVFQPFKVGGSRCRRFQHNVLSGSKSETVAGTACIRESGAWELIT